MVETPPTSPQFCGGCPCDEFDLAYRDQPSHPPSEPANR